MNILDRSQLKQWCEDHRVKLKDDLRPILESWRAGSLRLLIPEKASSAVAICYALLAYDEEDRAYDGGVFWVAQRGIWSEQSESVGIRLIRGLRSEDELDENQSPGHLLKADELVDAHSFLVVAVIFGWDTYFVTSDGSRIIEVSHDGFIDLHVTSRPDLMRAHQLLGVWKPRLLST